MAEESKGLMLTKKDIEEAIAESEHVKEDYPAFWKFYEMLMEMHNELAILQESLVGVEDDKGLTKR